MNSYLAYPFEPSLHNPHLVIPVGLSNILAGFDTLPFICSNFNGFFQLLLLVGLVVVIVFHKYSLIENFDRIDTIAALVSCNLETETRRE